VRYRVLVELKASRVVDLEAPSAEEALALAERVAFPGRHPRDRVRSMIAAGYPRRSSSQARTPRVSVPR
jgi:hypothetical protein